ncbi:nucleoside deaminase [Desulfopila inferna]|uniref:nucleoside deaminase n=1 Tax=Desulfopila inferna TaxID=468528 RepID=UPI0019641471|nr:nucleoside deaminase [Desulfopila inferna]MBM9606034.1 nucleoside deaminase [Desulfopila inferna]
MDEREFMEEAYREAVAAGRRGECPVGAVLVKDGVIVARGGNEEQAAKDPTAHAEMLCLRRAGAALGSTDFSGCVMYTTLWPCPMCQGAMLQAQVAKVVSGSRTFKWILEVRFDHAHLLKIGPVREEDCRRLFVDWARRNDRLEILEMEEGLEED